MFRFSKLLILVFFITLMLTGCDENTILLTKQSYPATYNQLDVSKIQELGLRLTASNPYLFQTVNKYGFIGDSRNVFPSFPPAITSLSKQDARKVVENFISENSDILGVKYTDDVNFIRIDSSIIYDGTLKWMFQTGNQVFSNLEVYNTGIRFHVTNGKVTWCIGNWYPQIVVPSKFGIGERAIKSMLQGRVVTHYNFAGQPYTLTISNSAAENAEFSTLIYPVQTEEKIEVRVVWKVHVPDVYFRFFIDVMSGEILAETPTIIS